MRRSVRPALALAAAAALVVPLEAGAATPRAAGTTVLRANGVHAAFLDIPRAVTFSFAAVDNPDVAIEGSGRLVAVYVERREVGVVASIVRLPTALGGWLMIHAPASSYESTCTGVVIQDCENAGTAPRARLRRGRYKVTVVTDGAPVEVTLRLRELSGAAAVPVTLPASGGVAALTPASVQVPGGYSVSAGRDITLRRRGAVVSAMWFRQPEDAAISDAGGCVYDAGHPLVQSGYRAGPACPGGSGTSSMIVAPGSGWNAAGRGGVMSFSAWEEPGRRSHGLYALTDGGATDAGGAALWAELS